MTPTGKDPNESQLSLAREFDAAARRCNVTPAQFALVIAIPLLLIFFVQGVLFMRANSQTFDEAIHLTSGYSYLATRQFRLFPQHGPLLPELSALPAYLWYRLPFSPDAKLWSSPAYYFYGDTYQPWLIARDFLYGSAVTPQKLLNLSRIPSLLLGAVLAGLVGLWSYRLWGGGAAVLAMGLAAVEPNMVANSSLVTSDLGPALFSFLTLYLLWENTRRRSGWLLAAAGISLGLAFVSKFSTVLLLAVIPVLILGGWLPMSRSRRAENSFGVRLLQGSAAAALLLFCSALVFPLVYFGFRPALSACTAGIYQVATLQSLGFRAFLLGSYSAHGWWSYFLVAFMVKTTIGALFLIFASLVLFRWGSPLGLKEAAFLLLPAAAFIAAASWGKIDIGIRHILPAYPFLFVIAARLATVPLRRAWMAPLMCGVPLLFSAASAVSISPHNLSYFNELAGGPDNGYRFLSDSNIDWGQDLEGLKEYMQRANIPWLYLSYFGTAPPSYYGIRYQYLPSSFTLECCLRDRQPAGARDILAISVTNLQETMWGGKQHFFDWLLKRKPIAKIGWSIYVYDITGDVEAHLRLADAYTRAGGLEAEARSEGEKIQALLSHSILKMPVSLNPKSDSVKPSR